MLKNKNKYLIYLTILFIGYNALIYAQKKDNKNLSKVKNSHFFFIENKGQIVDQHGDFNMEVQYLLNTPGLNVQLRRKGFSYDIYSVKKTMREDSSTNHVDMHLKNFKIPENDIDVQNHRVDIDFIGSNSDSKMNGFTSNRSYQNYFNIPGREDGIVGVRSFQKIIYENLYPNIDLEFFIHESDDKPVEYNFVIHPGGDISNIKMRVKGAEIENCGAYLIISTSHGKIHEIIPMSWQETKEEKLPQDIVYASLENGLIGFVNNSENISKDKTIVIDPTPQRLWSTYYGGELDEAQYDAGVKSDSNENVYISGYTRSVNNIATSGSFMDSYGVNSWNGFLAKFQPDGTLEWATYYGPDRTLFRSIAIDQNDNIIGVGETYSSTNIATSGAHQSNLHVDSNNYFDGFIVKFDSDGNRIWGSYFGGESLDYCLSVEIDSQNRIVIGGQTASLENIASPGAFWENPNLNANTNWGTFILLMDENGIREWSTYYGGQYGVSIDVDVNQNIYFTGVTFNSSGENISTPGAYQEEYSDEGSLSWTDSFLVKFSPIGERIWGTYFGADDYDNVEDLVVDSNNNIILVGRTRSQMLPTTSGAYQPNKSGDHLDWDTFITKFNTDGEMIWNTYYGGDDLDYGNGIDIDSANNIYVAGGTASSNNFASSEAFQISNLGGADAYLAKFTEDGDREWGTFYGGIASDRASDINISVLGNLYLLGYTHGSANLATSGAYQEIFMGDIDNFLVKFQDCLSSIVVGVTEQVCVGESIVFSASGGVTYSWTGPNGFASTLPNPIIPNASTTDSGVYSVYIESSNGCNDSRNFDVIVSQMPEKVTVINLIACEDNLNSGLSSTFDTSQIESQILNGQNNMIVSFWDENGNPLPSPLPNPMSNGISDNELISFRISNSINSNCFLEGSFELQVLSIPEIFEVVDFVSCDMSSDGIQSFDTSNIEATLLGGQTGLILEYYDGNDNALPSPLPNPYTNTIPYHETIIARVFNSITECYNETSFNFIVNQNPQVNIIDPLTGCDDNGDGISEYFDTSYVEEQVLNGQTGMDVTYYDSNGNQLASPLPNPLTNSEPFNQIITIRVTNTITTCFAETFLNLSTLSQPNINQPENLYACDEGNGIATFDTTEIENQLIGNQTGLVVFYFDEQGNSLPSPLPAVYQNIEPYIQIINVRVEDISSATCFSETSFNLIVNELPIIDLEEEYFICNLETSLILSIDPSLDFYQWKFEDSTVISITSEAVLIDEGNYIVTVGEIKNGVECQRSFSFQLTRSVLPQIEMVNYGEFGDNFIEIIAIGDGDFEYSIDGINYQDSNYFDNIIGGVYTVYVRDKEGCGEDSQEVILVDYPKYVTPNFDGYNDTWHIYSVSKFPKARVFIFDRYGKLLKELSTYSNGWDGTFNNNKMKAADYWFTADLGDGKSFKGHFSLRR